MGSFKTQDFNEQDFKDFGADQVSKCEDGFGLDCLVTFEHEGEVIVDPYAYSEDPSSLFGQAAMDAWKLEAAELMAEWAADNK